MRLWANTEFRSKFPKTAVIFSNGNDILLIQRNSMRKSEANFASSVEKMAEIRTKKNERRD